MFLNSDIHFNKKSFYVFSLKRIKFPNIYFSSNYKHLILKATIYSTVPKERKSTFASLKYLLKHELLQRYVSRYIWASLIKT